ncbi:MAG: hypothetical protein HY706_15465 [Candidatus Hydrogenedentes bacterium]|nr:hypothetical protein [Candidatus Hydrogenedentota bacterium]
MGELIYLFASLAARHKDGVTCLDGMRLLAGILHPLGVPITWIVSPESARIAAKELTRWHESFGDEVAVATPALSGSLAQKKSQMSEARDGIQRALPWSTLTIAAAGHTDPQIGAVLEDLGFEGLWGFCWEQIEVDEITDRGCPWGFYYMDREERLRPSAERGVVAMEWTARDLLKSFHSGNPCLYSTDPNDVARGGICSWENIEYWKGLADNYRRNTRYNDHVFLLQHQEAHEMERTDLARCYTDEDIREAAVMLERFVKYFKDGARMMTLPEAARLYRDRYPQTASSYMLWEDTPTNPYNPDYAWSTACGPWPKTFLFYDRQVQMIFIEGKVEPVCLRNYKRPWKPGEFFAEPVVPRTRLIHDTRFTWSREIEISVNSPTAMPFGMTLWGDYSLYQIGPAPGLIEGKIISRELLFLRYDLNRGENHFVVKLAGK